MEGTFPTGFFVPGKLAFKSLEFRHVSMFPFMHTWGPHLPVPWRAVDHRTVVPETDDLTSR